MSLSESAAAPFFAALDRFADAPAIIDSATGRTVSYRELETLVVTRTGEFGTNRKLVFVEAANDIGSIVDYLACLRGGHVVYLLEDVGSAKIKDLIALYRPHLLIDGERTVIQNSADPIGLHPDLALLLSTSGSTGSPKFVKLSIGNIDSNARSIAEYLELDGSERAFQHLKPFYSYGLSIINSHLVCGGAIVLTPHGVIDPEFWRDFKAYEATSFAGVPYTFETLVHRGFKPADIPSLRYATQAGGKLEAPLVTRFAAAFAETGRRFYVMYGQTEAAPRISYLPPALAARFPASIGKAIPGGRLALVDETGAEITTENREGELVYEGPNVMMGYATSPQELASDETPARLLTGDIAVIRDEGLFFIVGRSSRFVKPFGVRVNLDEVQTYVKGELGTCAVTGDDAKIVIAVEGDAAKAEALVAGPLSERFGLPAHIFIVRSYATLPLLASGKYDFRQILEQSRPVDAAPSLLRRVITGVIDILGLRHTEWDSVTDVYRSLLPGNEIAPDKCFRDLKADSLSFVALAIEMETLFKDSLPENWQDLPLSELERLYREKQAGAVAA